MNKIKTIIIDDEGPARRRMKRLLALVNAVEIISEAENGAEAIGLINDQRPDLILLDIQLKDMTGFEVLRNLAIDPGFKVIFITAYDTFAIQAFEANAIDYLLKPYQDERFYQAISKSIQSFKAQSLPSLQALLAQMSPANSIVKIKEGKVIHHLQADDLVFVKAEAYYCHFHLTDAGKSKMIRISLKQTENLLPGFFLRINKSVIINIRKISTTKYLKKRIEIELATGVTFTASKNYRNVEKRLLY